MTLVRTNNGWSCLAASFATVLGLTLEDMVARVGHDGSEVVFPDLWDPLRRRAFHPQEMIDVADSLGFAVTTIEARPTSIARGIRSAPYRVPLDIVPRFQRHLEGHTGVLTGLNLTGRSHAVVWADGAVHDPASGESYELHLFQTEIFWRVVRQGSPPNLRGT